MRCKLFNLRFCCHMPRREMRMYKCKTLLCNCEVALRFATSRLSLSYSRRTMHAYTETVDYTPRRERILCTLNELELGIELNSKSRARRERATSFPLFRLCLSFYPTRLRFTHGYVAVDSDIDSMFAPAKRCRCKLGVCFHFRFNYVLHVTLGSYCSCEFSYF